ncbi:MAG: acyltransferase [candidate division Zixibacteria bacterium]|nr:acyltransferase [candidate division Zixibacteria bacterium]
MNRILRNVKIGIYMLVEKLLRWCISPYFRSTLLRFLGARIGENVRIYEVRIINLINGFKNLIVEDDVHIGPGTTIDLTDKVIIKQKSTLSPQVLILTHSDAGEDHKSEICKIYPRKVEGVVIGRSVWIGAGSIIQAGVRIGDRVVIGTGSVVTKNIPCDSLAYGVPASVKRKIIFLREDLSYAKN